MSTLTQRSFAAGEIGPDLYPRCDTAMYVAGLRQLRNFFVARQGGAMNRPGTSWVAETKTSSKTSRIIPFVFNSDQTYVLEFGDLYMRVHRNGAQVMETAKTITAITKANPAVVTIAGHGYANGDEIYISTVGGMTQLNGRNYRVASVTANTFALTYLDGPNVNSTSYSTYTSGGTAERIYEIVTTYPEADLPDIQFVQSADVVTLVHPDHDPKRLSRAGHTSWTFATITFAPSIASPTGLAVTGVAGTVAKWVVTAVATETYEESLPSTFVGGDTAPTSGSPRTLTWTAVTGAQEYNVYRTVNGVYGFIGVAGSNTFIDSGVNPDTNDTPPTARNPFSGTDNRPSTVTYFQQRLVFANSTNDPEKIWMSKAGQFENFTVSSPIQDDDAITFSLAGRQVNEVRHVLDLDGFVILTSGGEHLAQGDSSGTIKPTDINQRQFSGNGSGRLQPLVIGSNALYVQAEGSIVRDLGFKVERDGIDGEDLTTYASHLVDGYTIEDWAFQKTPHSIAWMVRGDGVLLGLTYFREQKILAWHRHDFDGLVENVCVVPEGNEQSLYLTIKRTINGSVRRYIERMNTRMIGDIVDSIYMDSTLSYDGRNLISSRTMTLSGGTTWTYEQDLTLTCNVAYFTSTEVGNQIHLTGSDGSLIRFTIDSYTSSTVVVGRAHKTVPVSMRSVAISSWTRAVDRLSGLHHLEGKSVSILADGFVVANPNNSAYVIRTVTGGVVELDKQYSVIHVGLPYISDIETLDVDTAQGETLADKMKRVSTVSLHVNKSRGIWAGARPPEDDSVDPLQGLYELKGRNTEGYDDPVALATGVETINIQGEWNNNGRVFVRQVDPLPLHITAISPDGLFPFRGG